jgi:hypothetical protein
VNSTWRKPFTCGVALASISSSAAWYYSNITQTPRILVLSYVKAEGLEDPQLPPDPAPQYSEPAEYVIRIARSCGIRHWTMDSGLNLDAPVTAGIEVRWADISDETFGCLTKFVLPQRVTLTFKKSK